MKYLHIINEEKFTEPYIEFIAKYFKKESHLFAIIKSTQDRKLSISYRIVENGNQFSVDNLNLSKCMIKSEKIFIHGLFNFKIILKLFLKPTLPKKCYWIVWGGDLYSIRNQRKSIKNRLVQYIKSNVIKNMGNIVTLVKGDYELVKEWYKIKAKYYHAAYVNPITKQYLDSFSESKEKTDSQIIIQIGNSADPTNQHIEVLQTLQKFKDDNIKICVPLSYGNKHYAKLVIKEGQRLFGGKFVPLTEFLKPQEYSNYLNSIDIAIFNNDRQQALFNINSLIYLNKKVFIRSDTSMWEHFTVKYKVNINDTLSIKELSYEEFTSMTHANNKLKIECLFSEEYLARIWKPIFEENESRISINR